MKSWISAVLFLALSVTFCGCSKSVETGKTTASNEAKEEKGKSGKDERQERAARVRPAVPVKVSEVDQGMINSSLVFDSVLETESSVEIFAETSGLILEVHVEEGDRVVAGQILALMENVEEGVDAEEAKARYEHQKANFKRTEDLYGRKLINQQEYDNAKFDLEQMRLRFERAKIQLENTIVRSTVSGVVTERNAQAGRRVATNRVMFSIMNLDELFANVNIPGQHMLSIEQGLPAVIDSDLIEGVRYDAFVKLVSPIVDPESGTFKAKVAVSKLNGMPIYPGMFVNVRVIVDTSDAAVLIPKEAIVHEGDLKYIFKVQNGKAKKTLLQEGYSNIGFVQATSDIVKGDSVIVMGHSALKDGANVKIVKEAVAAEQGTTNSSEAGQG